jgi:glycine/D-amino acid oxidase-like deaminating enzyme
MPPTRILIVGAGLAGACAAFVLSEHADVTVLEAEHPAAGASSAAAGLVNPLMGRRASPVWRLREALDAVPQILDAAGAPDLFRGDGVLRPTTEDKQVEFFRDAVDSFPEVATWMPEAEVRERYPDVQTVDGAMWIGDGGAVDVPDMVRALLGAAEERGATVETGTRVTGWGESGGEAFVDVAPAEDAGNGSANETTERRTADAVLLCLGQGYPGHAALEALGLRGIKGQTVRVPRPPESSTGPLPPTSGRGYVVPAPDGTLICGSSYSNDFDDLTPDPEQTAYILEKTAKMLPGIDRMEPISVTAGVRVKTESTNLPIVGPLPGRERVWTFTSLGSKGLLTAPMLSLDLPTYLRDPATIPPDVRVPQ